MRQLSLILPVLFLLSGLPSQARTGRTDTLSVRFAFPQGVSALQRDFGGNAAVMDGFLSVLNGLNADPGCIIHSVNITTAASPEGSSAGNDRLARERARSILSLIMDGTTLSPSQIKVNSRGENWKGLVELLISECRESWRDEAVAVISGSGVLGSTGVAASARCKQQLKALAEGTAWRWMEEYAFGTLRSACGSVMHITMTSDTGRRERDTLVIRHEEVFVHRDTVYSGMLSPVLTAKKNSGFEQDSLFRTPVMALRSNLLLPLMNIGVEVPLSNRFSLGADWYYPWAMRRWTNRAFPSQMYCAQLLFGTLEARWWLGSVHSPSADRRYRLRGHSIGIVTTGGYYDLEYDGAGQQGEFLALGIDYLYALPLGKGGAHLEFNIGFGYGCNTYRDYTVPTEGGHLIGKGDRGMRHAPVPLRAGVSVAVPITSKREGR